MHDVTKALLRALPLLALAGGAAQAAPVADEPANASPAFAAPTVPQPGAAAGCAGCANADCAHCPMTQAMAETAGKEPPPPHVDCGGAK
jgi:hypothetical protein